MSDLYDDTDIVSESDMDDKDKEDDLSLNEREYVKPPSYRAEHVEDVPLILRLKSRIHADLHQINGVYDSQIQDAEKRKIKKIKEIEKEHSNKILYINKLRNNEINKYTSLADKKIDDLISGIHSSTDILSKEESMLTYVWNTFNAKLFKS
jgi:hypothetical protein